MPNAMPGSCNACNAYISVCFPCDWDLAAKMKKNSKTFKSI